MGGVVHNNVVGRVLKNETTREHNSSYPCCTVTANVSFGFAGSFALGWLLGHLHIRACHRRSLAAVSSSRLLLLGGVVAGGLLFRRRLELRHIGGGRHVAVGRSRAGRRRRLRSCRCSAAADLVVSLPVLVLAE